MNLSFYLNNWNTKRFILMSSGNMLIRWSCIRWNGTRRLLLDLVCTLTKYANLSSLINYVVNMEQAELVIEMSVKRIFYGEPEVQVPASAFASTSSLIFLLSRYV